jgi:hypothetical protein
LTPVVVAVLLFVAVLAEIFLPQDSVEVVGQSVSQRQASSARTQKTQRTG